MLRVCCWIVLVAALAAACRPPGWGKDPDDGDDADAGATVDGDPGAPDADVTAPDAATGPDAAPVSCAQTFRLEGQAGASSVWLTGDFVDWAGTPAAGAIELTLGGDDAWTTTRTFDGGSYEYKFIVDGATWMTDPANPNTVGDGLGGFNSVYVCE